ncbi:hypothetical protein N7509_010061 [Penicillium cosmopolitanum]|uniref:Uncharacterized protein n=1 Tax=Penicillium cosmopolitanum TaxID=1131564 RepID=A0A9W9VQU3_9EURO|nr:uncharacterized protein N7509_010061 [Penicillium cosmopolitanum]KAJ5387520.1 hypothetical protein N7509_010061 [Penicillium cosmopolitanum]
MTLLLSVVNLLDFCVKIRKGPQTLAADWYRLRNDPSYQPRPVTLVQITQSTMPTESSSVLPKAEDPKPEGSQESTGARQVDGSSETSEQNSQGPLSQELNTTARAMHDENQWTPSVELHWHELPPAQQLAPANGDDAVEVNEPALSLQVVHDYALLLRDGIAWLGECNVSCSDYRAAFKLGR